MNKLKNLSFSAMILLAISMVPESTVAQQIILINGQPTSVILNGEDIKNLVSDQLSDYMKAYGQEPDDEFVKGLITLPEDIETVKKDIVSEKATEPKVTLNSDNTYVAAVEKPQKKK